ncbi:3-ketoacyl-CoA synthase 5-like [Momordica charantia]|uniref:3-ketoacyl-CoA synthase n=1 Tax=Momordica charantia TaxID=3673 RepID=A0A6J1CGF6_MOMCH|nr:3-ketoacyl-CoA synthase 5-like [Momordica charantia]
MESAPEVIHGGTLLHSTQLLKPLRFTFFQLQILFVLLTSIEAYLFLEGWNPIFHIFPLSSLVVFIIIINHPSILNIAPRSVYLVDFSCLKPPSFFRVPFSTFLENATLMDIFDSESLCFMAKTLKSSGQSEETCLPPALHFIPPKTHQQESINEAHMVLFPVMDDLLTKTHLSPRDIDILIVNCSGFCPSPCLSSIVINKYSMRSDIKSFNLSGMGCSASAVAIHLAESLLQVHKNSNAVVLSTEILSNGWYAGKERSKLILNCLFRMGSGAILLTNRKEAKDSSKYKLFKTVRTQRAFDDKSYLSAIREDDMDGKLGVTLTRDLLQVAGETLRSNITILGDSVLPLSEKLRHGVSRLGKRFLDKSQEIYVPNFKSVIQHFCLPVSGGPVIREIGKMLKLKDKDMEAALMTLHRFGNQSSSSLWYELAYLEDQERIGKGDRVWQLGMGTGPKCVSLIWESIRPIVGESNNDPWAEVIQNPISGPPT